jgi:1-acyl-sn-glycerol-3-phosphate acyltransferase
MAAGQTVKNPYFPHPEYDTPEDTRRDLGDRLLLGSRWWFYLKFAVVVLRSRSYALKGIYDDGLWAKTSHDIFRSIEACGGRFHLTGLNNLADNPESLVIISNHMSTLETMIFPCIFAPFHPATFVVKDSLVRGIFGPIMRSRKPVVVGRQNPRRDLQTVLVEGTEILRGGKSIIIFPQATRRVEFSEENFNSLGIKLARRAGVRIMPVAIKTDFWGNGRRFKEFGPIHRDRPIHMSFGEPAPVTGSGGDQHRMVIDFIRSHLEQWKHAR